MKVYLVGGAVRDELLGLPVRERDWCVVGGTPEEMLALGFKPVGRDFPVFLHPQTGEEYALARTERKTAVGYHGFAFHTDPDVTIEDDLARRDLTINALAKDDTGTLVDPFGGRNDLQDRLLRHVSDAFAEDPVRVLRVAKFAARFHALGFRIAGETLALMRNMVECGEVEALVPERVWRETEAALAGDNPQVFFDALRQSGALRVVFPEVDALFGVPQPAKWHPEIDCGIHTMMVLEQAALLSDDPAVRFAALVHDLGKATSNPDHLPAHRGHEARSVKIVKRMASRLPIPTAFRDLGLLVAQFHGRCHRAFELKPSTVMRLLHAADAFRRPRRFEQFLLACEADARGRTGFEDAPYPQADYLRGALSRAVAVPARPLIEQGFQGEQIGKALDTARLAAVTEYKLDQSPKK